MVVARNEVREVRKAKTRKASNLNLGSGYYSLGKGELLEGFKERNNTRVMLVF